jgi:hypothetical protein
MYLTTGMHEALTKPQGLTSLMYKMRKVDWGLWKTPSHSYPVLKAMTTFCWSF